MADEQKKASNKVKQRYFVAVENDDGSSHPVLETASSTEAEAVITTKVFYEKYPWLIGKKLASLIKRDKMPVLATQDALRVCSECKHPFEDSVELTVKEVPFKVTLLTAEAAAAASVWPDSQIEEPSEAKPLAETNVIEQVAPAPTAASIHAMAPDAQPLPGGGVLQQPVPQRAVPQHMAGPTGGQPQTAPMPTSEEVPPPPPPLEMFGEDSFDDREVPPIP